MPAAKLIPFSVSLIVRDFLLKRGSVLLTEKYAEIMTIQCLPSTAFSVCFLDATLFLSST